MQDQVTKMRRQGISAISLSEAVLNDVKLTSGCYTLVYSSPESLLNNEDTREIIGSRVYKERVFGIVVDEAHCISHWYVYRIFIHINLFCISLIQFWPTVKMSVPYALMVMHFRPLVLKSKPRCKLVYFVCKQ